MENKPSKIEEGDYIRLENFQLKMEKCKFLFARLQAENRKFWLEVCQKYEMSPDQDTISEDATIVRSTEAA